VTTELYLRPGGSLVTSDRLVVEYVSTPIAVKYPAGIVRPDTSPPPPPALRTGSRFAGVIFASRSYTEWRRTDGSTWVEHHKPTGGQRRHGESRRDYKNRTDFWWRA
jgi:hypothetical protein